MIKIKNLSLKIKDKKIYDNIDLEFGKWNIYCLLWKNWSWKSSISQSIAWNPKYSEYEWEITVDSEAINWLSPDEISKKWIFLAFQNIPEIPGIKLQEFLRTIYNNKKSSEIEGFKPISPFIFSRILNKLCDELSIPNEFMKRDLNVWFSWWEKRKIEILQMKLLEPKYIILDEIDSGLDLNSVKLVREMIKEISNKDNTFIIITHNFWIIEGINIDKVIVMKEWKIIQKWTWELIDKIKENGF